MLEVMGCPCWSCRLSVAASCAWHSSSAPQSFWKGISSSLLASFLFRIGN